MQKKNIPALTSLRFFAAAMIVVHHTTWYFGYGSWLEKHATLDVGVSFFYVLSGFILFYSYRKFDSFLSVYRYLAGRVSRVWPLHFVTWLMVFLFLPYPWGPYGGSSVLEAVANLLLIQSWIPHENFFFSFNAVSWSLSVEAFFYVIFPILIWRWNATWWLKLSGCLALIYGLVHIANLYKLGFQGSTSEPSIEALVYIQPLSRLFEFVAGIATCSVWLRLQGNLSKMSYWLSTGAELTALALVIAAAHLTGPLASYLYNWKIVSLPCYRWLLDGGATPPIAFMICIMASGKGVFSQALSMRLPVLLGEISFSVYMTHQVLMRIFMQSHSLSAFGDLEHQYLVYWGAVLLISYLLWEFAEKPCRERSIRMFMKLPKLLAQTASDPVDSFATLRSVKNP